MSLFQNLPISQAGLAFPTALAEKYRPHALNDFVGLEKPKKILAKFAEAPYPSAWLFLGPSGTGKTSMALAFCETIHGELHHIPSQQCTVENIDSVVRQCHYVPSTGKSFHAVLVDEGDRMSKAAQLALLSNSTPLLFHRPLFSFSLVMRLMAWRIALFPYPADRLSKSRHSRTSRKAPGGHLGT